MDFTAASRDGYWSSVSNTRRTARSRRSAGYGFLFDITTRSFQKDRAWTKPGAVQSITSPTSAEVPSWPPRLANIYDRTLRPCPPLLPHGSARLCPAGGGLG